MSFSSKSLIGMATLCACSLLYLASSSIHLTAQEATRSLDASQRFQISAWGYSATLDKPAGHGAYIIDSSTGKIWVTTNGRAPREIGSVTKGALPIVPEETSNP